MIKNVILDMGNVLLDYNPRYSLEKYLDNEADRALIDQELFRGPEWAEGDLGLIRDADRYTLVRQRLPERLDEPLKNIVEHWSDCMVPVAGAREFVADCKAAGYRVYILSNASDLFYTYFSNFAPLDTFDGHIVSCDIHATKPHQRIYRHLLNRYHLRSEECFFIDDVQANLDGAAVQGIQGMQFKGDFAPMRKALGI